MIARGGLWIILLSMIGATAPKVTAADGCFSAATTELERLYCKVVAEGGGATLPAQSDFNRNDPEVQALLLKRPAQRLGLTLPEIKKPAPESASQPVASSQPPAPVDPSVQQALAACELAGERIRCPGADYVLAGNQSRSSLPEGALSPENRLQFAAFTGDRTNEEAVRRYLSDAYDQYIPKMLRIGLGANTMSFTAFHNAFHTLEEAGVDFAERMSQTYQLLKQDRQQLGVQTRYHDELPENLSLCGTINRDIIVCDNVGTNWVYLRSGE